MKKLLHLLDLVQQFVVVLFQLTTPGMMTGL